MQRNRPIHDVVQAAAARRDEAAAEEIVAKAAEEIGIKAAEETVAKVAEEEAHRVNDPVGSRGVRLEDAETIATTDDGLSEPSIVVQGHRGSSKRETLRSMTNTPHFDV
jgi:hypothetical protein